MTMIKQVERERSGGFLASIGIGISRLADWCFGAHAQAQLAQPAEVLRPTSDMFLQACQENSNSALDWLYYATQLADAERRYCIHRALEIDPQAATLLRALNKRV
jgi:hypothetical protein